MKKLFLIFVLILATIVVNAQRTPVKVSALPEPLPDFLKTNYPGYVFEKADKVLKNNNEFTYETVITNGTSRETLVFDQNGKFLKNDEVSKPILKKSNVNTTTPALNNKTNTNLDQHIPNSKNVSSEKEEEEEPVQKNEPDTLSKKKQEVFKSDLYF